MKMLPRLATSLLTAAALSLVSQAQEIALETTYAAGNGQSGNMFDVKADVDVVITRLDAHIDTGTWDVEIYTTPGSYQGKSGTPGAWALIGSVTVNGLGDVSSGGLKTPIPIALDVPIAAGATVGFYVTLSNGTSINYTNGTTEGAPYATDGNITFFEGIGLGYPFGGSFSPRIWNGTLYYSLTSVVPQQGYKELYTMGGGSKNAAAGASAATIGDLDNDGFIDCALGSPGAGAGVGRVIFHSGKTGNQIYAINGPPTASAFGAAICGVGDVDGDGADDLLVGAPGSGSGEIGRAYVYLNGTSFVTYSFEGTGDGDFGAALANVGDIDLDGRPDFAIGAPRYDSVVTVDAGSFKLFSGASGAPLFFAESALSNDRMGSALIGLGDVDGDGVPDWAVGSPGASLDPLAGDRFGRVQVWSGATKAPLFEIFGAASYADFGATLTSLGDVTGDGIDDLAVGAPLHSAGIGAAFAFSGADGTPLYSLFGTEPNGRFGQSLALVGDTSGDGTPDLAIGAPAIQGAWGYVELVNANDGTPTSTINRLIQGTLSNGFGTAILPLGDIDGTSLDDFLVSAPGEYASPSQGAGNTRTVTSYGTPLVATTLGVHSLDSGEYIIIGSNFINPTVRIDNNPSPISLSTPVELRIPISPDEPGGFHTLTIQNSEGTTTLPAALARYPAFDSIPTPRIGDPIDFTLDNGDDGIYVLSFSGQLFATPAPFENFGWYYGLELNGVWPLAAGVIPPGSTKATITIPPITATTLIGVPFFVQAFTTQTAHGYAGFTKTLPITLLPALP